MSDVQIKANFGGLFAERHWITIDFGNDQSLNIKVTEKQLQDLAYGIANVLRTTATYRRKNAAELTKSLNATLQSI